MPLEVTDLSRLSERDVQQSFAILAQLLQEAFPNIDTRRGVLGDLVLQADAILDGSRKASWDRLRRSLSLKTIAEDPTLADDDIVDRVLANWGVSRGEATPARGEVTIVLSRPTAITIGSGEVFVANGRRYLTETAFTARTAAVNVVTAQDRLLTQVDDDRWAFTVNVVAEQTGTLALVRKDTGFVPAVAPPAFVRAYAASDFVGATDSLTTDEMLEQQQLGIAARAYSNRTTTEAMIRSQPEFAGVEAVSIIGAGDAEMLRDAHSMFPISFGGRTDLYVRTRKEPLTVTTTMTATLVNTVAAGGVWQLNIDADTLPGFYEVAHVQQITGEAAANRYSITSDTRGINLHVQAYAPDIVHASEAVFSAYQTATVRFIDPDTPTVGLSVGSSTRNYLVSLTGMPLISDIQAFIGRRDVVNPAGDHLVRAAVPCFTSINLTVKQRSHDVDVSRVINAVAAYVNDQNFTGSLYSTTIAAVIRSNLNAQDAVSNLDMLGRIQLPAGGSQIIRARDVLTVPDKPLQGVSARTVCFLTSPADISVTVI